MQAPDLTPNIGLAWYLNTEAFPATRLWCQLALLLAPWLAALPLACILYDRPVELWTLLSLSATVFGHYPSLSDLSRSLVSPAARPLSSEFMHMTLQLSLWPDAVLMQGMLPLWGPKLQQMPSKLFMVLTGVAACVLHPAMCHAWLQQHVVNANFAFAASILLSGWQVLLYLQLLSCLPVDEDQPNER